jgi:hypothetical protein
LSASGGEGGPGAEPLSGFSQATGKGKWPVKSDGVLPCDEMPAHVAGRSSAAFPCQSIHGVESTIRLRSTQSNQDSESSLGYISELISGSTNRQDSKGLTSWTGRKLAGSLFGDWRRACLRTLAERLPLVFEIRNVVWKLA